MKEGSGNDEESKSRRCFKGRNNDIGQEMQLGPEALRLGRCWCH